MNNKPELPEILNESTVFDFGALIAEEKALMESQKPKTVPKEKSLFERVISGEFAAADTTATKKPIVTRKKEEATGLYEYILLKQLEENQTNEEDITETQHIKPHRNLPPDQHLIEAGIIGKYTGELIPEGNPFGSGGAYEYLTENIRHNKR